MFTALKIVGMVVGIKLTFDIIRFAIIETYYSHKGWESGVVTYGVDEDGNILTNVPSRMIRLLMDSRAWEYTKGYELGSKFNLLINKLKRL